MDVLINKAGISGGLPQTATFNNHRETSTVEEAGKRIVKYATLDADGPTGKYFSEEYNPETGEIPW